MDILQIGGTGVLSSAVTFEALKHGIGVTMINRGNRANRIPANVELIKADKNNRTLIEEKLKGRTFDAVIDYLSVTDEDITLSYKLYSNYTKQYLFISSCAVYDTRVGGICDEDSPKVLPIWKYSVDKWKSELLLQELSNGGQCHYTVIRPCVTYDDTRIPYGIAPIYGYHWTLCARILAGKPIIRWNGGVNRCNMTRVEDFAVGVVGLIGNPKAYDEAFNVCGEECPSFNEVLDAISECIGKQPVVFDISSENYASELPSRKGEILGGRSLDSINSNKKIKSLVPSFGQTIYLKEGVKMTIDAYKNNNYQKGIDWVYDADSDRIIKKYSKKNGINYLQYNLHFIDYLGCATSKEKKEYFLTRYKNIFPLNIYLSIKYVLWRISHIPSKLLRTIKRK